MNVGDTLIDKDSTFTLISFFCMCSETITKPCKKGNSLIELLRLLRFFKCLLNNLEKKMCFL